MVVASDKEIQAVKDLLAQNNLAQLFPEGTIQNNFGSQTGGWIYLDLTSERDYIALLVGFFRSNRYATKHPAEGILAVMPPPMSLAEFAQTQLAQSNQASWKFENLPDHKLDNDGNLVKED